MIMQHPGHSQPPNFQSASVVSPPMTAPPTMGPHLMPPQVPAPPCPPLAAPLPVPPPSVPSMSSASPSMCPSPSTNFSFSVQMSSPRVATVLVRSENFEPLKAWMPWIEWDGCWLESYPLQTEFRVATPLLEASVHQLMARRFMPTQSRLAARM